MRLFVAVVLLAVLTCTIAQPPAGFLDHGRGRLMNLQNPFVVSRRSANELVPLPSIYVPRFMYEDQTRYVPPQMRQNSRYDWLSREINHIRMMNDVGQYRRDMVLPDELLEKNHYELQPVYHERISKLTYFESKSVSNENNRQVPEKETLHNNERSKFKDKFAFTPTEPEYFSHHGKSMKDYEMTMPMTTPEPNIQQQDEFEERRQTRQNPNLSRAKSLLNQNFEKNLLSSKEKPKPAGDFPKQVHLEVNQDPTEDIYGVAVLAAVGAALTVAVIGFGYGWYTLAQKRKLAAEADYPGYGVTGPSIDTSVDRKLAQSAHMYHYQHQKQQIMALERNCGVVDQRDGSISEPESEEENEGDYTVYEYPGFATTGDMVVKNPIYSDDPTPVTPGKTDENKEQKD